MIGRVIGRVNSWYRKFMLKRNEHFNFSADDELSIIASTCNGGVLCKDLCIPFNSPFVNLWIEPKDFLKILKDLKAYLSYDLLFIDDAGVNYPVALLGDVKVYFMHYASKQEAADAWYRRCKRVNYEKILVMFTDRDGCTYEDLCEFDKLDYNKVVFTAKQYNEFHSAFQILEFAHCHQVGILTNFIPAKLGVRYYDSFNFKKWIEEEAVDKR